MGQHDTSAAEWLRKNGHQAFSRSASPSKSAQARPIAKAWGRSPSPTKSQQQKIQPLQQQQQQQKPQTLNFGQQKPQTLSFGQQKPICSEEPERTPKPIQLGAAAGPLFPQAMSPSVKPEATNKFPVPFNFPQPGSLIPGPWSPSASKTTFAASDTLNPQPGFKPVAAQTATMPSMPNVNKTTIKGFLTPYSQSGTYESHIFTLEGCEYLSSYTVLHPPPPFGDDLEDLHRKARDALCQILACNLDNGVLETVMSVVRMVMAEKGDDWLFASIKAWPLKGMKCVGAVVGSSVPTTYLRVIFSIVSAKGIKKG